MLLHVPHSVHYKARHNPPIQESVPRHHGSLGSVIMVLRDMSEQGGGREEGGRREGEGREEGGRREEGGGRKEGGKREGGRRREEGGKREGGEERRGQRPRQRQGGGGGLTHGGVLYSFVLHEIEGHLEIIHPLNVGLGLLVVPGNRGGREGGSEGGREGGKKRRRRKQACVTW